MAESNGQLHRFFLFRVDVPTLGRRPDPSSSPFSPIQLKHRTLTMDKFARGVSFSR